MEIKIKSITDVITNSSSECYTIKSSLSLGEVKDLVLGLIESRIRSGKEYQKDWDACVGDDSIIPIIDSEVPGEYHVDWEVLCNLDGSYEILCELFGKDNVTDDGGYSRFRRCEDLENSINEFFERFKNKRAGN